MTQTAHQPIASRTTTLSIAGMTCGACVRHVTRALEGMSGVAHVEVSLDSNQATIEHVPALVDAHALIAAVRDAGYAARVTAAPDEAGGRQQEPRAAGCGCCSQPAAPRRITVCDSPGRGAP